MYPKTFKKTCQKGMPRSQSGKICQEGIPKKKKACHEGMARSQAGKAGQVKKTKPERQTIITKHVKKSRC